MEKKCVKCQKLKSIDEFNKHNIIEYDNLFMCETCKKEDDEFFEWSMDFFKKQMIEKKQSKEAKDIIAKKKKKASIRGAKYCKNRKEIDPLFKLSLNPVKYRITNILWCDEIYDSMNGEVIELKWWQVQVLNCNQWFDINQ